MILSFQKFTQRHFAEYQSWLSQAELRRFIGEIDEEWLQYVLKEEGQEEFAVFQAERMLGEVGIALPTFANLYYVITNLTVNPLFQSQGIGSAMLQQLLASKTPNTPWRCYVHQDNLQAQAFFRRNDWMLLNTASTDEHYLAFGKR